MPVTLVFLILPGSQLTHYISQFVAEFGAPVTLVNNLTWQLTDCVSSVRKVDAEQSPEAATGPCSSSGRLPPDGAPDTVRVEHRVGQVRGVQSWLLEGRTIGGRLNEKEITSVSVCICARNLVRSYLLVFVLKFWTLQLRLCQDSSSLISNCCPLKYIIASYLILYCYSKIPFLFKTKSRYAWWKVQTIFCGTLYILALGDPSLWIIFINRRLAWQFQGSCGPLHL